MNDAPLLVGSAAAHARDAARRFSAALLEGAACERGFDLCDGDAGLAIVHAGLEEAFPGLGHAERAQRALSSAIRAVARTTADASLGAGFTGVAWVAELLCGSADEDGEVDLSIERLVAPGAWRGPYDLLSGLAGVAIHALERLPRPWARRVLASVVDTLGALSVRRDGGIAWRTDEAWIPEAVRDLPLLEWNLGAAHGAPGVIAVLGRVCASRAGVATRRKARALLEGAVTWVLAQELRANAGGCFPMAVGPGVAPRPARSAWCYGDPGVAAALFVAGLCAHEDDWTRAATRIALTAAARDERRCGVTDAGLCHGAAGLGHLYHRMFRATGDERLARAARVWLAKAVAMADPRAPFVWSENDGGAAVSQPGLLCGGGGVALALLAATGDADADWDRALGMSAIEAA